MLPLGGVERKGICCRRHSTRRIGRFRRISIFLQGEVVVVIGWVPSYL